MVKLLEGVLRPSAKKILEVSNRSPKRGIDLSNRGIAFGSFEDWLRIATRVHTYSPHQEFWRSLSLLYPPRKTVKHFGLLFEVLKDRPLLTDQARALLFSLPAKRLPNLKKIQSLEARNSEQIRVKQLLIKKKKLGDEAFLDDFFHRNIELKAENCIRFSLREGYSLECEPLRDFKRLKTIYGFATLISTANLIMADNGNNELGEHGLNMFILVDGEAYVRRQKMANYTKVVLEVIEKKR